jgi:hypothetical protein
VNQLPCMQEEADLHIVTVILQDSSQRRTVKAERVAAQHRRFIFRRQIDARQ